MPLRYIYGQDELVADFVARSKIASGFAKHAGYPKNAKAIGIANSDNELIAGLVYFNFNPEAETIEFSAEALPRTLLTERWLTPTTLAVMFQYPFLHCGCQMLITKTSVRAVHVCRMLEAMNFKITVIERASGRNEDGVIATLTDDAWLNSKFCKRYGHDFIEPVEQKVA